MRVSIGPLVIGMPQLGPYGLSESWLLSHLGDLHWRVIAGALGAHTRDIIDEHRNRLYASFVRVTWTASSALSALGESDELTGCMDMVRFGDGVFLSDAALSIADETISMRMASLFTRRERDGSNDRLLSAAPAVRGDCPIPEIDAIPPYVSDHRLLKTGRCATLELARQRFDMAAPPAESIPYAINGFADFNGANLLYFAAYPRIADACTARSRWVASAIGYDRFVTMCGPRARDIFYFGNADLADSLACAIGPPVVADGNVAYRIDLSRASDGSCISRQLVIRESC
jgi:probable biosynthetic protein (TIGR04098 family)